LGTAYREYADLSDGLLERAGSAVSRLQGYGYRPERGRAFDAATGCRAGALLQLHAGSGGGTGGDPPAPEAERTRSRLPYGRRRLAYAPAEERRDPSSRSHDPGDAGVGSEGWGGKRWAHENPEPHDLNLLFHRWGLLYAQSHSISGGPVSASPAYGASRRRA